MDSPYFDLAKKYLPKGQPGVFTIELDGNLSNAKLSILDLNGRTVYAQAIVANKTNIDLKTIANGLYTVVLVSNDTVSSTKMMVAK